MLCLDVNVLIYAHREDAIPDHAKYASWITRVATGHEPFAISVLALAGLVRIATNQRVFPRPSTLDEVFAFLSELRDRPQCSNHRPWAGALHDSRGALPCLGGKRKAGGRCPACGDRHRARLHHGLDRFGLRPVSGTALATPAAAIGVTEGSGKLGHPFRVKRPGLARTRGGKANAPSCT